MGIAVVGVNPALPERMIRDGLLQELPDQELDGRRFQQGMR
jgi:hypothetical protein